MDWVFKNLGFGLLELLSLALLAQTHVLSKIGLHLDYIYHLKALVAENPKISSTKSSKKCQEIITKHIFFCLSSSREFRHFVCLFIFRSRVSRQTKNQRFYFGIFENNVVIFTFWISGDTLVLFVGAPPQAHRILCSLPIILSGHNLYGGSISDLIAFPARGVLGIELQV